MEKRFFCRYRKDFGSKLYLFPCKNYSFWRLLFSVFWFVKHHLFKPHVLHFQLNYECDVIFAVPQICAYFVDIPHNLEIDSFKIAVRYVKLSWVTWLIDGVLSLSTGKHSTYFHRICVFIHILRYAMRNIIPSNNGLDVERLSFSWLLDSTLFMLNLSTFLEATVYGK